MIQKTFFLVKLDLTEIRNQRFGNLNYGKMLHINYNMYINYKHLDIFRFY